MCRRPKARMITSQIACSFASDCLRSGHRFSQQITQQKAAKAIPLRIPFNIKWEFALRYNVPTEIEREQRSAN